MKEKITKKLLPNRKRIFLILFLCSVFNLYSQNPWELLNPKPSYQNGMDIHFISNTNGFIMNESQLLKTTDTGQTWVVAQPLIYAKDINFKNSVGFIVGLSGYVLKSIDYGQTWVQINTTFSYAYNSVTIIDDNNIILSSNNKIVKTTDGGITWTSISVTGYPSIVKTFFTSTLIGHAACNQGKILKTINGGINWYVTETVSTIPSNFLSLYFINENIGFATREHDLMFKTINAGESWTEIPSINQKMNCIHFSDQNNGFTAGEDGFIYKTNDGGNTWTSASYVAGNGYSTYFGVYFLDNNTGFVCGERGRIAKTTNGGITWSEYSPTYNDIKKIQFKSNNVAYSLIAINGNFLKTIDGGSSWQIVGSLNQFGNDFDFVNENIGYATTTDHGRVYKTINGGLTWLATNNNIQVLNDGYNSKVYFYNENIGFAMGGFNSTRTSKTINGGNTWQQIANHTFSQLNFLNPSIGFGLYGGLNKTIDGGLTWTLKGTGISAYHVFDENTIYAVGNNTFKKTTDGGTTWQSTNLTNSGNYTFMKFYNNQIGYMMRDDSTIFRTLNGGQTWFYLTNFFGINHFDLFDTNLSVSGNGGVIFKSSIPASLDLENYTEGNNFIIYPNPASEIINILFKENIEVSSIYLYNFLGEKIYYLDKMENTNQISIDSNSFSNGVYFINVKFKNGKTENKKILIK
ncbi:YCF48-related protein [Flavobacterium sp. j3]|uniref:YCF48-related protein n=1 Tax=Flavobacterium aureirubrum TaxID=3133147 RepID=A0ABU9N6Q9_9FLAO